MTKEQEEAEYEWQQSVLDDPSRGEVERAEYESEAEGDEPAYRICLSIEESRHGWALIGRQYEMRHGEVVRDGDNWLSEAYHSFEEAEAAFDAELAKPEWGES